MTFGQSDSVFIKNGDLSIKFEPKNGGKIAQIFFKELPILSNENLGTYKYGSVWWPGPQNDWKWPPPKAINEGNYTFDINKETIILESETCEQTGIQLKKIVEALSENKIKLTYIAENKTTENIEFDHWEVTRLPKRGLALFPLGKPLNAEHSEERNTFLFLDDRYNGTEFLNVKKDLFFYQFEESQKEFNNGILKIFANGKSGWSAFIQKNTIFIKVFEDVTVNKITATQGEIELYISPESSYIELEQHSKKITLKPGQSSNWVVHWLITENLIDQNESVEIKKEKIENYINSIHNGND